MKRSKRLIALLLVVILVLIVVTGCGRTDTPSTNQPTVGEGVFEEHQTITIALWDINPSFTMENDPLYAELSRKLNITIDPIALTWNDYHEKVNIWAASGELPDVFAIDALGTMNFRNWVAEELVRSLPEDLSEYPTLSAVMESPDIMATQVDGKYYNIPRVTYDDIDWWAGDRAVMVRQDWMESVGITKDPENINELITLLTAFVEQDPNQTGREDTIGMTTAYGYIDYILQAYNPAPMGSWIKEDGRFIPSFFSKHTIEGIKALKQLYDLGLFDRDYGTMESTEGIDKFASARAGMLQWSVFPEHQTMYVVSKWQNVSPDKKYIEHVRPVAPLKHYQDGNMYRFITTTFWSESYIHADVDDAKFDRILRLFDYMLSDEGKYLMRLGIEGTDYQMEGDQIVITRDEDPSTDGFMPLYELYPFAAGFPYLAAWGQEFNYADPALDIDIRNMCKGHLDFLVENAKAPTIYFDLQFMSTPLKDQFVIESGSDIVRIVLGTEDPDTAWTNLMEQYNQAGLQAMLDEVNDEAARLGTN